MKEERIHLFYLRSNFHLLIASEIIRIRKIDINNIKFITNRNINIPVKYNKAIVKLDNEQDFNFWSKLKFVLFNRGKLPSFLNTSYRIYTYIPFFSQIPFNFFDNITFFEEGFSAYSSLKKEKTVFKIKELSKSIFRILIVYLVLPCVNKNLKSFIIGPTYLYFKFKSKEIFDYYVLSKDVNIDGFKGINLKVIGSINKRIHFNDIPENTCLIVMDRLSSSLHFDVNNYIKILELIFKDFKNYNILLKFHPSDSLLKRNEFVTLFFNKNWKFKVIDHSLEDLCLSTNPITLVGTNSTILYYSKILGNNMAFSYSKKLSEIDPKYAKFLKFWGSEEIFYSIFEKKVIIK